MTASIVIVIAQGLINVYEQLQKQNYTLRVKDVIKNILSGMKERDRWGNIEKSKTLARCTFLDPRRSVHVKLCVLHVKCVFICFLVPVMITQLRIICASISML